MSFKRDLSRFVKKTNNMTEKVFKGTTIGLFNKVVQRTPVETGRLRNSWQPSVNSPSDSTKEGGSNTIETTVLGSKIGDKIYITNNLPYAKEIEGGSSRTKAPQGMVAVTVAEYQSVFKGNVINAKRGK
tara:strand:+ start:534 stop:920 length:387 start_codon:yes stop_codon:yes gene_type:complete